MNNESVSFRALFVYNGDLSKVKQDALLKTTHIRTQDLTLDAYRQLAGITVGHRSLISRQPVNEQPILESKLAEILKTNPEGQRVIIDDFTRLISATETVGIKEQLKFLLRYLPKMFSIQQHNTILGIGAVGLFRLARIEAIKRLDQSTRAKKAAASKDPVEIKATSRKANGAKSALARKRAVKLRQHIDRFRDSLPESDQSNRAAIARQLNEAGVPTPSGKGRWQTVTISRVLDLAAEHDRRREELRQMMEARKQKGLHITNRASSGL